MDARPAACKPATGVIAGAPTSVSLLMAMASSCFVSPLLPDPGCWHHQMHRGRGNVTIWIWLAPSIVLISECIHACLFGMLALANCVSPLELSAVFVCALPAIVGKQTCLGDRLLTRGSTAPELLVAPCAIFVGR